MSLACLSQIIHENLPQTGVSLVFAYGSKVLKQSGHQQSSDLIDVIIATDDPLKWHQENFERNADHYSFLKYLPSNIELITKIQESYGARIYYNAFVEMGGISLKYGLIKTRHLLEDLDTWNKIYVAGRLHKPVEFIVNTCDKEERLKASLRFNKESALRAALIQLPETFTPQQLYLTIAGLSYTGDPRMYFGEDKNKVSNIVTAQKLRFDQLYMPMIKLNQSFKESVQWSEGKQLFTQDLSPKVVLKNLRLLPFEVRRAICCLHKSECRTLESDAILTSASRSINCDKLLAIAIASIVRRSSTTQSLKGLLTAGLTKSIKYSQKKLLKSLVSRFSWN